MAIEKTYNVKVYFQNGFTHLQISASNEPNAFKKAIDQYEKTRKKYVGGTELTCVQISK